MSTQSVETILSRAMSDTAFAASLFSNPERALVAYDLSAEETASLKAMTRADFETLATGSPEERRSFSLHCAGGTHIPEVSSGNHNETALHVRR
jgi:hypothetical protein